MSCPYCGGNQIVSYEPFDLEGERPETLAGVEHMRCTTCGGISLTLDQMEKIPPSKNLIAKPSDAGEDPYRPIRVSPDDPRIVTPRDVNGFMEWGDDPFDEEGGIYERF